MLEQNTRESAVRREEFHEILRTWLDDSLDDVIGDPDNHAGQAWLWVRHGGDHFYLDGASNRAGVRSYVRLVEKAGGDPEWTIHRAEAGSRDRIAIGRDRTFIEGFDFYRHTPGR
jgi:hypothetical protein